MLFFYNYLFPLLGLWLIKLVFFTYRFKVVELKKSNKTILEEHKLPCIYVTSHQRFFPILNLLTFKKPIVAMVSQSIDGEFISRILSSLAFEQARGSSSKNGLEALRRIIFLVRNHKYNVGYTLDGPRGPMGIIKPGIIKIAQVTGAKIVPIIVSCKNYWVYNSWDNFLIPKPFSTIKVDLSKTFEVPALLTKEAFEKKRIELEFEIQQLYKKINISK